MGVLYKAKSGEVRGCVSAFVEWSDIKMIEGLADINGIKRPDVIRVMIKRYLMDSDFHTALRAWAEAKSNEKTKEGAVG